MKNEIKKEILKELKHMEKIHKIKILFAIESGSRAWGWESKDSDYDIRAVFIQDYNKVEGINEQIEYQHNKLDIVLWDLKKFLLLMKKSNPSTWEWLSSDIIYKDHKIREYLKNLFNDKFNAGALRKHYLSMARDNFHKYIIQLKEGEKANLKKYVYILRSVACDLWIEIRDSPPPKCYKEVIVMLPEYVKNFFNKVVKDKIESENLVGKRNFDVENYLVKQFNKEITSDIGYFDKVDLNKIFKRFIK
jgi:hypothetical protein